MATTEFDSALEQRLSALERANAIRSERQRLRREVKSLSLDDGCHRVAEILEMMPRSIVSMKVGTLLLWPWSIQERRALRWMRLAGCSYSQKVEKLTERQRALLIDSLRG